MIPCKTMPIGALGTVITGRTPPSALPETFGSRYPFITPSDMDGEQRWVRPERWLSDQGADLLARIALPSNAICVVCIGATIGKVCMTRERSFSNQQINSLIVDESIADPSFVFHILRTKWRELRARAGGAATPILNKSSFSEIELTLPPLGYQRAAGRVLSAYDDLIENCERRIRVLDEMARALYREWFVNFRYPRHEKVPLIESSLGKIPKGWQVQSVADSFETMGGGTPSRKVPDYWEGGAIPWFSPSDLTSAGTMFMDESGERITARGLQESSAKMFPEKSVMLTSRATIGAIAINTVPACTNQGFITCIPNERFPLFFLYQWVRENVPLFVRLASGATFKEISRGVFRGIDVLHPPVALVARFNASVESMGECVLATQRQVVRLRAARDLLLPRLLSGQLSVAEAA